MKKYLHRLDPAFFQKESISILLIIAIITYPILFIWQCGDLTDSGFLATNYSFFFENLKQNNLNVLIFFSDFLGAIWNYFFSDLLGFIGFKLMYLIFLYFTLYLTYIIIKNLTSNRALLLFGILVGEIFAVRYDIFVFSYDIASWFFLILTSHFIFQGLNTNKFYFFYISGLCFFFAFLSRFSDVIFIFLLPIFFMIIYTFKIGKNSNLNLKLYFKNYLFFILGIITMFSLLLIILYKSNFITSNFLKPDNSHSISNILKSYIKETIDFIPYLIIVPSLLLSSSILYEYLKSKNKILFYVLFLVLLLYVSFIFLNDFSYISNIKYFTPAFCVLPLLFSILHNNKYSVHILLIFFLSISQIAGTNTGVFLKFCYGLMILIPITILVLSENYLILINEIKINLRCGLYTGVFLILFFSIYSRIGWIYHVDFGLGCRFRSTSLIENNKMKGIFTIRKNAFFIKSICNSIKHHTNKNETIFIYGHKPMLYYLTNKKPIINRYWLANDVITADELFKLITKEIMKTNNYPAIIDTKEIILGGNGEEKLKDFLSENNYKKIVNSTSFNIWKKVDQNIIINH